MVAPIVSFDLDGTLLDEHNHIHPRDKEILLSRNDIIFMPCTGRPYNSVVEMFHNNGMFLGEAPPFPVVANNGSVIYLPGGKLLQYRNFSAELQQQLLDVFYQFPQAAFMLSEIEHTYLFLPSERGVQWLNRFLSVWYHYTEDYAGPIFGKITGLSDDPALMQVLMARLSQLPVELSLSMPYVLDINPQGVNKRTGVMAVVKAMHLEGAPIFAAGDGGNDLDLLKLAKVSFSPATSADFVKRRVDRIVDTSAHGLLCTMLKTATCP
ncbi:MAG: HAD family phosphatase [Chloroflexi bacterium]|nr:HAD family phosphatase [Chloroflexota bacterium]